MGPVEAKLRPVVRAITVIVPLAMLLLVVAGWWAKGSAPPVQVGALGVEVDEVRVVGVRDPDAGERRLERIARQVAPEATGERLALMDQRRARYVLGHVAVPARAQIPEGSRLFLAVSEKDPEAGSPPRTSSWLWARGSEHVTAWSQDLDDAADQVPWLSRRGSMPTASPTAIELTAGDDLLVYAGLARDTAVRDADEVAVGLVWLGPGGRLWGHQQLS